MLEVTIYTATRHDELDEATENDYSGKSLAGFILRNFAYCLIELDESRANPDDLKLYSVFSESSVVIACW